MIHQTRHRWARALVAFFAIVGLGACFPESKHPLSTLENSVVDDDLIGLWFGGEPDDDEHAYYAFLKTGDTEMDIVGLSFHGQKHEWILMSALTTTIGSHRFLSVVIEDASDAGDSEEDDEAFPYLLCRYVIDGDGKLKIYLMNDEAMAAALKAGAAPEEDAEHETEGGMITAPTDELRAAIANGSAEALFDELLGIYERRS